MVSSIHQVLNYVNEIHDPGNNLHNGLDQGYSGGSVGLRRNA